MITLLGALLAGCGGKDATDDTGVCAEAPLVTWETFGHGFLIENCQGCHASTSTWRVGAPEDVSFDTLEDAWTHADRILERAGGATPSMPPAGGTSEDDRWRLEMWLRCGTPGT